MNLTLIIDKIIPKDLAEKYKAIAALIKDIEKEMSEIIVTNIESIQLGIESSELYSEREKYKKSFIELAKEEEEIELKPIKSSRLKRLKEIINKKLRIWYFLDPLTKQYETVDKKFVKKEQKIAQSQKRLKELKGLLAKELYSVEDMNLGIERIKNISFEERHKNEIRKFLKETNENLNEAEINDLVSFFETIIELKKQQYQSEYTSGYQFLKGYKNHETLKTTAKYQALSEVPDQDLEIFMVLANLDYSSNPIYKEILKEAQHNSEILVKIAQENITLEELTEFKHRAINPKLQEFTESNDSTNKILSKIEKINNLTINAATEEEKRQKTSSNVQKKV